MSNDQSGFLELRECTHYVRLYFRLCRLLVFPCGGSFITDACIGYFGIRDKHVNVDITGRGHQHESAVTNFPLEI